MRFGLFTAVMLLASLFSGCLSQDDYIGTYRLEKTPSKTLEIRDDGTYLLVPEGSGHTQKIVYMGATPDPEDAPPLAGFNMKPPVAYLVSILFSVIL